jgi:hypothetical protein
MAQQERSLNGSDLRRHDHTALIRVPGRVLKRGRRIEVGEGASTRTTTSES